MKFNFYLFVLLYCVLLIVPYVYSIIIETNYTYSGSFVTITIPNGINYAILTLYGASGGSGANTGTTIVGGTGGVVKGQLSVVSGEVYYLYVGGQGQSYGNSGAGGYNGGGSGGDYAGGGGGATDLRTSTLLLSRILVAGGAGGGGDCGTAGNGGGYNGGNGTNCVSGNTAGNGGTQYAGGTGGTDCSGCNGSDRIPNYGGAGTAGNGGAGAAWTGGGGGGGYYGGGGSGSDGGGGGGSSYIDKILFSNIYIVQGSHSGDGFATVKLMDTIPTPIPTAFPSTVTPSTIPSVMPTVTPTVRPSVVPTVTPTARPTVVPTRVPTTDKPSSRPSSMPSSLPSSQPSFKPTNQPSTQPSSAPSSQPSAQPSSQPTSHPTVLDIISANLLGTTITTKVVKTKLQYYIGAYIAYFTAIYVFLYLFASTKYGVQTVKSLYDSSYHSGLYQDCILSATNQDVAEAIQYLYISNQKIQEKMSIKILKISKNNTWFNFGLTENDSIYSNGYITYVCEKRCLLGCKPLLYPNGFKFRTIVLPPGRLEDWLLYVCNNHSFFSCFYYVDGHQLGAHGTKLMMICKDIVVFVLSQFSAMVIQYISHSLPGINIAVSLFIITPASISIGFLVVKLYTCSCIQSTSTSYCHQGALLLLGRVAIVQIVAVMGISLILACLFSDGRDVLLILVRFAFSVQMFSIILQLLLAILAFQDNIYYSISLFKFKLLQIGNLYCERIVKEGQVSGVHYESRVSKFLGGHIIITRILSRDEAIRAGWIRKDENITELVATASNMHEDAYIATKTGSNMAVELCCDDDNKMVTTSTYRDTITISMDAIYGTNTEEDHKHIIDGGNESLVSAVVENPIYYASTTSFQSSSNKVNDALRLQQSTINNSSTDAAMDDEQSLYEEYQSLQSKHDDDAVYDMNETVSFEEWKLRKKQFKQGTRGSFIKAFELFEEREQLFGSDSSKLSASVANTMHLQASYKVKNALAVRTTPAAAKYNNVN